VAGINVWAVLVAAVSSFVLGGLWYSKPLFGERWSRYAGMAGKQPGHPAKVFGIAFVFALIAAAAFAFLVGPDPAPVAALHSALIVGGGFVATSFGINYQFGGRPFGMWLIDAGYHLLQFVLYALVYAYWP